MTKNEMINTILHETKAAYIQWRDAEINDDYDNMHVKRGRYQALRNLCIELKLDYIEVISNVK